jgi:pimeloyl-ACP methyl ester carboxylesterase
MKPDLEGEAERRLIDTPSGGALWVTLRGEGPLLLMINGIGAHVDMWEPLAKELSQTRRLILFDAPGAGTSPPLPRRLRMSGLARLLAELLDGLAITQLDVLGYSWGGALAQQFTHDFPERVKQLILIATMPGAGGRPPKLRVAAAMLTPGRYRSSALRKRVTSTIYGGDYRKISGKVSRELPSSWSAHPRVSLGSTG